MTDRENSSGPLTCLDKTTSQRFLQTENGLLLPVPIRRQETISIYGSSIWSEAPPPGLLSIPRTTFGQCGRQMEATLSSLPTEMVQTNFIRRTPVELAVRTFFSSPRRRNGRANGRAMAGLFTMEVSIRRPTWTSGFCHWTAIASHFLLSRPSLWKAGACSLLTDDGWPITRMRLGGRKYTFSPLTRPLESLASLQVQMCRRGASGRFPPAEATTTGGGATEKSCFTLLGKER